MADEPEIAEGGEGTQVSLTELLEDALVLAVQAMSGQAIGVVDAYNTAETGADRVSITPLVPLLVAGDVVPAVKVPSVPVAWPQLGAMSLKFPLLPGSFMRLSVLGHDHSGWTVSGTVGVPPTNERRFSLSDLVAVPSAPSPLSSPPDPTSYDAAWGVLFGQLKVGSSAATKAAALHLDNCPAVSLMATWMGQVEAAVNILAPGDPEFLLKLRPFSSSPKLQCCDDGDGLNRSHSIVFNKVVNTFPPQLLQIITSLFPYLPGQIKSRSIKSA